MQKVLRDGASDDELRQTLRDIWIARADRYSETRSANTDPGPRKIEMYHLGG